MTNSFFNSLDYFFISLILISCLIGIFRGFVKDFFSTCSWLGSGFATAFTFSHFANYMQKNNIIHDPTYAKIVAGIFSFSVIWITLQMVINIVSHSLKSTMLSGLDRAFGALYGFIRGFMILIVICVCAIMSNILNMEHEFIANSKITPMLINSTDYLLPKIMNVSKVSTESVSSPINKNKPSEDSIHETKLLSKEQIRKNKKDSQKQAKSPKTEKKEGEGSLLNLISRFFDFDVENTSAETSQIQQSQEFSKAKNEGDNLQLSEVDLIKARAKRKTQKKAERIRRDLMKSLDNAP
ncbi:MAG: CvpA family protein [Alphaproteobacteria bacterium]|nr:CvpA family protein [Alphaproteobacteria bacterium]